MKTKITLAFLCAYATFLSLAFAENLLKNPGFEELGENFPSWSVASVKSSAAAYAYSITRDGGGHGVGGPYAGERAIEIYSSDRVTQLSQMVSLTPGTYRFSCYARNETNGDAQHQLVVKLGTQQQSMPVVSMSDYRLCYVDFKVDQAGMLPLELISPAGGLALDDLSFVLLEKSSPAEDPPYLFFDLLPTSLQRSKGHQTYLIGQQQWLNYTVSCVDLKRLDHPRIHFYVPTEVKLTDFNEHLLRSYGNSKTTDTSIMTTTELRDGVRYEKFSFALPRFESNGLIATVGGAWLEVHSGETATMLVELEDRGRTFPTQEIELLPVAVPARQVTPKKILTVAYSVQNWTQLLSHRLEAVPQQFKLMGFNVWSDFGLHSHLLAPAETTAEDQVRIRAHEKYGVQNFWPNFCYLFEVDGEHHYPPAASVDQSAFVVNEDGTVNRRLYNMRFVAENGKAWRDSVLAAYQSTLKRPHVQAFPFRNNGFINDSLESIVVSYDPLTLQDFTAKNSLDPKTLTIADLHGKLKLPWLRYNLNLYEQSTKNWHDAIRQVDPQAKTVVTASSFGPIGAQDPALPIPVQTQWAQHVDYSMPQWYGFMRYYDSHWYDEVHKALKEKVYGDDNGRANLIPLLNISMNLDLEDPKNLRFKMFDLLSASSVVKGIGYYIASNGFADGQFMAGLSEAHTLLADVEDYYVDGKQQNNLARYQAESIAKESKIKTSLRFHTLSGSDRVALLTVITHSHPRQGEEGIIYLSDEFLNNYAGNQSDLVIFDYLNKQARPFSKEIKVDTHLTFNLGLLEIMSKGYLVKQNLMP